jgi:O-methyltransferase
MTTVQLRDLTPRQLIELADLQLRQGRRDAAYDIYKGVRAILNRTGMACSGNDARIGLAYGRTKRSLEVLDILEKVEVLDNMTAFVGDGLATWFKSTPFTEDERFMTLAQTHGGLLPVINWHWNLQTVVWAVNQTREVAGDFVELGVFKAHTTTFVADYLGFQDWPKTWWLYDTFDGIPADQLDEGWAESNQGAYDGTFSFETVRDSLAAYPNIKVIKGRVPEILAEQAPDRIAFLHMDLNNATAEVQALDVLYERISPGGVIVFDDYCWAVSRQQRIAEDAWAEARGLKILPLPTGQGLLVKR